MRVSDKLMILYANDQNESYPLEYRTLFKTGDKVGSGTFGLMRDANGDPLKMSDGSTLISNNPDGNTFIGLNGRYFLITHAEEVPGQLYHTEFILKDNTVMPLHTATIDLGSIGGTIINCASSRTHYGSHLGGEEDYELNSRYADKNSPFYIDCEIEGKQFTGNDLKGISVDFCHYIAGMQHYLHDATIDKNDGYNGKLFTPYNYGYIVELQPQSDGSSKVAKHTISGKYTPELAVMMPDHRTLYMSDDGTYKGFYKLVLDKAINHFTPEWKGRVYAAKVQQLSIKEGGSFALKWIFLGDANDSSVQAMIDSRMKLSDIFSIQKPSKEGTCKKGFKKINEDDEAECLKLKAGMEKAAAFLETRKYAAYKGATTEFRKEEGLSYNPDKNLLYLAMSQIEKSMEDNYQGEESQNDIRLPKNPCGGIYEITLDKHYNATKMKAILVGKPLKKGDLFADEWACDPNGIANPDNIKYLGHNLLLIGEDTHLHLNNMLWAYDTNTGMMTRIASLPIGAEVTGLEWGVVGNKGLLFVDQQHPFKDNPVNAEGNNTSNGRLLEKATDEELRGIIGSIDGIPATLFGQ